MKSVVKGLVLLGILAGGLAFSGCSKKEIIERIGYKFDSGVDAKLIDVIASDIESMPAAFKGSDDVVADSSIQHLFKIREGTGGEALARQLLDWLDTRVTYIIPDLSGGDLQSRIQMITPGYSYPNREMPVVEKPTRSLEDAGAKTLMSNMGGAIYIAGKMASSILGFQVGPTHFPVLSPRIGIVAIGEGLTSPKLLPNPSNPKALANTLSRMTVYFHEARHSDGNGKSLSFAHAVCPSGDYRGLNGCDRNLNGPYRIGAEIGRLLLAACKSCTPRDRMVLKALVQDSFSRIIFTGTTGWDETPEEIYPGALSGIDDLRNLLRQMRSGKN